ncbi:hypothetical protein FHS46_002273 [Variibacter gotjawalensis]|nr:hypothetical protein [Variibacter gotjawalensis]NIK47956.1 hypothetical protein [Variibacter gotjawalensis]
MIEPLHIQPAESGCVSFRDRHGEIFRPAAAEIHVDRTANLTHRQHFPLNERERTALTENLGRLIGLEDTPPSVGPKPTSCLPRLTFAGQELRRACAIADSSRDSNKSLLHHIALNGPVQVFTRQTPTHGENVSFYTAIAIAGCGRATQNDIAAYDCIDQILLRCDIVADDDPGEPNLPAVAQAKRARRIDRGHSAAQLRTGSACSRNVGDRDGHHYSKQTNPQIPHHAIRLYHSSQQNALRPHRACR